MGATAFGALGVITAEKTYAEVHRTSPLQFYGGFASGVRPDLSPPSVSGSSVVWSGMTDTRRVALTFDDGPMPDWTPQVLRALARHDVPATFFLKGINVQRHGAIHSDSVGTHELGNHTWDHPDLARLDYTSRARSGWSHVWLPSSWVPTESLWIAPWRCTLMPFRKKVAGTSCLAKALSTWGVQSGIGPSSNVNATRRVSVMPDQTLSLIHISE